MISVVTPWRTLLSALGLIGRVKSEWVLMSIKPGVTASPAASMTLAAPCRQRPPERRDPPVANHDVADLARPPAAVDRRARRGSGCRSVMICAPRAPSDRSSRRRPASGVRRGVAGQQPAGDDVIGRPVDRFDADQARRSRKQNTEKLPLSGSPRTTAASWPAVMPAICNLRSAWSLQNHGTLS